MGLTKWTPLLNNNKEKILEIAGSSLELKLLNNISNDIAAAVMKTGIVITFKIG